jgi:hypothetical protein
MGCVFLQKCKGLSTHSLGQQSLAAMRDYVRSVPADFNLFAPTPGTNAASEVRGTPPQACVATITTCISQLVVSYFVRDHRCLRSLPMSS